MTSMLSENIRGVIKTLLNNILKIKPNYEKKR